MRKETKYGIAVMVFIMVVSYLLHHLFATPELSYPLNICFVALVCGGSVVWWLFCPLKSLAEYIISPVSSVWMCIMWIVVCVCMTFFAQTITHHQVADIQHIHNSYTALAGAAVTWVILCGKLVLPLRLRRQDYILRHVAAVTGAGLIVFYLFAGYHDIQDHQLAVYNEYRTFLSSNDQIKAISVRANPDPEMKLSIRKGNADTLLTLSPNHPVRYKQWDISLVSCQPQYQCALLHFVYDPWQHLFRIGLALILIQLAGNSLIPIFTDRKFGTQVR
ncbi:MAG: hypothetical protein J5701_03755 [Bacteroidales bacterium]|nr:hypothetical protein [Bacteroidales bacterium]